MTGRLEAGLSMGINGDDPIAFAALARDLDVERIVVNHNLFDVPGRLGEWRGIFEDAGLRVESVAVPSVTLEMLREPAVRDSSVRVLDKAFAELESQAIAMAHSFIWLPAGDPEEKRRRWDDLIDTVAVICRTAADHGVRLAWHFGWTPDLIVWNTDTALRLVEDVGAPNCGILYCPGSFFSAGDNAVESARALGPRAFLVHLRDARTVSGECDALHLGQGVIPFRDVLAALQESGYCGLLIPEHLGPASGQQREEVSQAMALGYLRALLESLRYSTRPPLGGNEDTKCRIAPGNPIVAP